MFNIKVNEEISLELIHPIHTERIFNLIIKNKNHLIEYLPLIVTKTNNISDTQEFIKSQYYKMSEGKSLHTVIIYNNQVVGLIAFNKIIIEDQKGEIGYWLDNEFTGKGIVTKATIKLIEIGFTELNLNRIEIIGSIKNNKSMAIPERLGFTRDAILRQNRIINGQNTTHLCTQC